LGEFQEFAKELGIKIKYASVAHPKSNGCQCSGYRGILVQLLLGLFNGPAWAQGWNDDRSQRRRPS
jgi:hypothetical protein